MVFLPNLQLTAIAICCSVAYLLCLGIYRLYFHPLARFPGPRLGALSGWYETYYDVYLRGQFAPNLRSLHEKYGPIVRFAPNQVNIHDLDFYEEIYAPANRKRNRKPDWKWSSAAPYSSFGTVDHDLHRRRRGALNPFFSKKAVQDIESIIQSTVAKLCQRLRESMGSQEVVRLDTAFSAVTTDIITAYSFGKSFGFLNQPDFNQAWKTGMSTTFVSLLPFKHFPWVGWMVTSLPPAIVVRLDRTFESYLDFSEQVNVEVRRIMAETPEEKSQLERNTIFHEMRDSTLPSEEKTFDRLSGEALAIVGAGSETTARTLFLIAYHLLSNKDVLARLRAELKPVFAIDRPSVPLPELEHLPYLTAVILEGLRYSGSFTMPQPRIAPAEALQYKGWYIPPGTVVCQVPFLHLHDPNLWSDPESFNPDHWLKLNSEGRRDRLKVVFGTGPRNCLGMNLAYAELYRVVAEVFHRFAMELVDTSDWDVSTAHYTASCVCPLDSKGIRARVTGVLHV